MFKMLRKNKKGFTLVELLVVIAIIGILAAVIAPNAFKAVERGKVASVEADYKAIKSAALNYYTDTGLWPVNNADSKGFVAQPDEGNGSKEVTKAAHDSWNGPYLERWPARNPWGGTYDFVNGTSVAAAGITSTYKYIKLDSMTTAARDRLEVDLDGGTTSADTSDEGVVRWNHTTFGNTVYLVISEQ